MRASRGEDDGIAETPAKNTRSKRKIRASGGERTAEIPAKKAPLKREIWLPTECWTDTFKFLSRRDLLQRVQPVDRRFHAIAEMHVDNVHVIREFGHFVGKLKFCEPEANRQLLEEIEASNASLAKHFRVAGYVQISLNRLRWEEEEQFESRYAVQMRVLRNSAELFRGCNLNLVLGTFNVPTSFPMPRNTPENIANKPFVSALALFQPIRPCQIRIIIQKRIMKHYRMFANLGELFDTPTIVNCTRLTFVNFDVSSATKVGQLLEQLPSTADGDSVASDQKTTSKYTGRVIFVQDVGRNFCTKLIERCKKNLSKAKGMAEVRPYLVVFKPWYVALEHFRLDHSSTGEVLQLVPINWCHNYQDPSYALRRCLRADLAPTEQRGEDLATTNQLLRETFTPKWNFRLPVQQVGKGPPATLSIL